MKEGKDNYSLCESLIVLLLNGEEYQIIIDCFKTLSENLQAAPRLRMYLSKAYLEVGNAEKAERLALMGTASSSESGMTGGFRARVDGNKPVVFMVVVNYAKKNLENKDNQFALGRIVVDKTGYADVKTYDEMVAAAKDGDNFLFLAKLFAVAEEVSRNVGAIHRLPVLCVSSQK